MLKTFKVTNFYGIGNTQELSLLINKKDLLDESAREINSELAINLVACVIGHNASGKTTIMKALTFALLFIRNSYNAKKISTIPFEAHALHKNEPTIFEIEFLSEETLFYYSLVLNNNGVIKEYLGQKIIRGFSRIFEYTRDGDNWDFRKSDNLHINPSDLKRFKDRKHVSVFSSLLELDYIPKIHFFKNLLTNVDRFGLNNEGVVARVLETSDLLFKNEVLRKSTFDFLKQVDLGLEELAFREVNVTNKENLESEVKTQLLQALHKTPNGEFLLDYVDESNGTQLTTFLISKLIPVLNNGGIAILDEIEAGLHPYVIRKIISLFESKRTNPQKAQLIFSTHQHIVLNDRTKTQIFIAEKNMDYAETEVFRLDEIEGIRNDENYFHKYISGTYGGTPEIDFF